MVNSLNQHFLGYTKAIHYSTISKREKLQSKYLAARKIAEQLHNTWTTENHQIKSNKVGLNLPTWPRKSCGYMKKQNCKPFFRVVMSKYTK